MSEKKISRNKTYNVLPGTRMGLLTTEYLEKLTEIARKHNIPFFKITPAKRLAIVGHSAETAERIWQDLGQKTVALGEKLEKAFSALPLPAKTKIGVSGCPLNCCESYVRDIGVFGKKNGWSLVFGGNGGGCPRIGDIVAENLSDEEVIEMVGKCLDYYRNNARPMERTGRFMRRLKIDAFWEYLGVRGKSRY
jgi:NAD(P)H-nitrite reductase large subunit